MAQPHIVLLGPAYPYRGGNALFMAHLYDALKEEFRISFINYSVLYPSLLFPGTTQYDQSEEHFIKVPSERLVNSMNPLSWYRTAQRINELNPDLVAIDWWQPYFGPCHLGITTFLKPALKKRLLFITENLISHEARAIDQILTRMGLAYGKRFLTLSGRVAEEVRRMFGEQVAIYQSELPTFGWYRRDPDMDLAAAKAALGFEPGDTVLLFFGYVRKYKGLDILIDAFAELSRQRADLKLLVAGEFYDEEAPYREQVEQHGLQDKVVMINRFIPNEEVARFFTLSEVVVLPYRSATQSGILAITYGYEKPIVITDVGGLRESVADGQTGIVVEAPTPAAVVAGVNRYFQLKTTVDFPANIRQRVADNAFLKINEVFRQILRDL